MSSDVHERHRCSERTGLSKKQKATNIYFNEADSMIEVCTYNTALKNGEEGGWDVIYENANGIPIPNAESIHTIYVEMKNKHNTMNSASAGKTFIKMQNQLLNDDDCACFLVEAIAQRSQNIKWETTVDKKKVGHKLIRRVSLDQFYALVTGQEDAFYQMCMVLPSIIEKAVKELDSSIVPHDTVIDELKVMASEQHLKSNDMAIAMAAYMLGFGSYKGFTK